MTAAESRARARDLELSDIAWSRADVLLELANLTIDPRLRRVLVSRAEAWSDEVDGLRTLVDSGLIDSGDGPEFLAELAQQLAPTLSTATLAVTLRSENRARVRPPIRAQIIDDIVARVHAEVRLRGAA